MKTSPGRVTSTRLAILPDGDLAEVALDASKDAWARWYSGGSWGAWHQVASGAMDIEVASANADGAGKVLVVTTPASPGATRRIFAFGRDSAPAGTAL